MNVVDEAPLGKSTFLATEKLTKNVGPLAQCRMEMGKLEKKLKPAKGFMALDQMLMAAERVGCHQATYETKQVQVYIDSFLNGRPNVGGTYHRTWAN